MDTARITVPPALGQTSVQELLLAIDAAARDHTVRTITLAGSPGVFCRGLDFAELLHKADDHSRTQRLAAIDTFGRLLWTLRSTTKPTIALVDGPALGGGVGLAAACDVVLSSERASFALPEVLFGLLPAMILPYLLERMAAHRARLWALTGLSRGPREALADGLVDVVVSSATLEHEHERWRRKLGRAHGTAVAELKRFTATLPLSLSQAVEQARKLTALALNDEAVVRSVRSFVEDEVLPWEN